MEWINVNDELPQLKHTMGCGNKYSDDVLVTNGEDCYVANLEAVRPDFKKQLWNITQSDDLVKDYSGKDVTHWMVLPKLPSVGVLKT